MGWLWLFTAATIFAVCMYLIGRYLSDDYEHTASITASVIVSLVWPLVLAVIVVIGPFAGLYYLGAKRAQKAKEKSGKK